MKTIEALRRIRCEISKPIVRITCGGRARLGKGLYYRRGFFLNVSGDGEVRIGDGVFFNNYCSINCRKLVAIGNGCTFGEGVKMYDHDHDFRHIQPPGSEPFVSSPISIGKNCWFGSNVVVLKGVTIGDNVIVGAGTVVTKDIPSNSIVHAKRDVHIRELC